MGRGAMMIASMLALANAACSDESEEGATPPVVAPTTCGVNEHTLPSGACTFAGVASDGCAEGFEHDGERRCEPVLPAEPCAPGAMALPGESRCRPVGDCGNGRWGNIALDGGTQYVDAGFVGTSSGTEQQPWVRIQDAIDAAAAGGLVAIAAGSYTEELIIRGGAKRVWGRCASMVEIVGPVNGTWAGTVNVREFANGSEIGGVSITGGGAGVTIEGSGSVVMEELWVHDTTSRGINVQSKGRPTSASLRNTLIESTTDVGVFVAGADVSMAGNVVRDTAPMSDGLTGCGVAIQDATGTVRANVSIAGSLIERNADLGVLITGVDVSVAASVIRDTRPRVDGKFGRGIAVQSDVVTLARANVSLSQLLLERNQEAGIMVAGADVVLVDSVVRDTQPNPLRMTAAGIVFQPELDEEIPSTATVAGVVIERTGGMGMFVGATDVNAERLYIANTTPGADGVLGDGIAIYGGGPTQAGHLQLTDAVVLNSARAGLSNFGSSLGLSRTLLSCQAFDIDIETYNSFSGVMADEGDNGCGCPSPVDLCKAVSANLSAPEPLDSSR